MAQNLMGLCHQGQGDAPSYWGVLLRGRHRFEMANTGGQLATTKKSSFRKSGDPHTNISAPEVNGSRSNGRAGSHHERYGSHHERYGAGSVAIPHNHPPSTKGCKSGVSRETAPIRRITTAALPRRHRNRLATSNGWTWDVGGCQWHHRWGISSPTMSWGGDHHMPKTQT